MSSKYPVGYSLDESRTLVEAAIEHFEEDDYENALMVIQDLADETGRIDRALRQHLGELL